MGLAQFVWKVLLFSSGLWFLPSQMDDVIADTKYGKVLGISQAVPNVPGPIKRINKFLGVPYARKPIGDWRFKPPQPVKPWKRNFYNASVFGNICVHPLRFLGFLRRSIKRIWPEFTDENMSEDCLYLNIYAPVAPKPDKGSTPKPYPVIFYIHGGSYLLGTPIRDKTPGDVVPLYGVVLVTIHYRLGALGFLTTGDSAAPGNYGMLDQIQALRWVQENIGGFGGDPQQITICGNSAGGSSVGLHLLSPLTKGLFQKAIIESGSEFSPFAFLPLKKAVEKSKNVARKMLCDTDDHDKMVKCLQSKDAVDLVYHYEAFPGPVIDNYYLLDTPANLRKAGKFHRVPLMLGFTKHDGYHAMQDLNLPKTLDRRYFRKAIERAVQKFMDVRNKLRAVSLADALDFVYYPWGKTADSQVLLEAIVNMCTDYFIIGPTMASASAHARVSPTYLFEYLHVSNDSSFRWVSHSSNVDYAFGAPLFNLSRKGYNDQDREVSQFIMKVYSNFANYGNPTPEPVDGVNWTAYSQSQGAYMQFQYRPQVAYKFEPRRTALWNYYVPKITNWSCSTSDKSHVSSAVRNTGRTLDVFIILMIIVICHMMRFSW